MCTCLVQIFLSDHSSLAIVRGRTVTSNTAVLHFLCWLLTTLNSKITTLKVTTGIYCHLRGLWVILPGLQVALQEESLVGPVSDLELQKLGLSQMALGTYVEVTELSPPFLEHSETREKCHIKSLILAKFTYFSWKTIVFTVHTEIRENLLQQSLLRKQDIYFYSMLWRYRMDLVHNQRSTATPQSLQV